MAKIALILKTSNRQKKKLIKKEAWTFPRQKDERQKEERESHNPPYRVIREGGPKKIEFWVMKFW